VTQGRKPLRGPRSPKLQDTIRLGADGLAKVLGDLEARVMRALWDLGELVSAKQLHERVAETHHVSLMTVITVANRMTEKGLVRRVRRSALLHYETRMTEPEFMAHASRHVVEGVVGFEPDAVAASFVDVWAERDPERLAALARLIQERLRGREADASNDARSPANRSGAKREVQGDE
jgi:predicted transcriptional regulator